jgi:predicted ATPase
VHRLAPLALPPNDPGLSATVALGFPATQMFVERARSSGADFDLTDSNAAIIAGMCRRLDGVPLAIELAAGRVEAYGLEQTAALLDQRLALLWLGQRTAPPRQKTLQATLDWSFGLLSGLERTVLRRLSVFVGFFTLEAAIAVVTNDTIDKGLVVGAIDSLVAKSMVATRPLGAMVRYRLLPTTRTYARDINDDGAAGAELAMRHATYFRQWLERAGSDWPALSTTAQRAPHLAALGNVRAALEWCFGANGNIATGIELAAAAAPVFLLMSLLTECHRWSERALHALDDTTCPAPQEMQLQTALGLSMMFTKDNSEDVREALTRGLELAKQCGDLRYQLQLLGGLHLFHERIGEFSKSLPFAQRSEAVARAIADPVAIAAAHSWLGISHHLMGNVEVAQTHLEAALASPRICENFDTTRIGFEYHNRARITLARNLWLRGYPDQAAHVARRTVEEAAALGHPVTLCMALIWAVTVFAWRRDWPSVEENIDRFIAHADRYSLAPYHPAGIGVKGELSLRRGDVSNGIALLLQGLNALHASRYELLTTELVSALAEGLAVTGQFDEALATIERAIGNAELHGRFFTMPELLRIKATILTTMPLPDGDAAETCLRQSLDLSRRQATRAWELRTAVDLATLWGAQGRAGDVRRLLPPVFAQFSEGFDTVDLQAAECLLETLA